MIFTVGFVLFVIGAVCEKYDLDSLADYLAVTGVLCVVASLLTLAWRYLP